MARGFRISGYGLGRRFFTRGSNRPGLSGLTFSRGSSSPARAVRRQRKRVGEADPIHLHPLPLRRLPQHSPHQIVHRHEHRQLLHHPHERPAAQHVHLHRLLQVPQVHLRLPGAARTATPAPRRVTPPRQQGRHQRHLPHPPSRRPHRVTQLAHHQGRGRRRILLGRQPRRALLGLVVFHGWSSWPAASASASAASPCGRARGRPAARAAGPGCCIRTWRRGMCWWATGLSAPTPTWRCSTAAACTGCSAPTRSNSSTSARAGRTCRRAAPARPQGDAAPAWRKRLGQVTSCEYHKPKECPSWLTAQQ